MVERARPPFVLIVEDEDNIAVALEYVVKREGYGHARIADGADVMPFIRSRHPEVVLLDIMLPSVSGYEICQEIRLDPTLSDVKVVMMTARGSALEKRKAMALGADGFVSKPFDLGTLRGEIKRIVAPEEGM
ncbi:MAG: response regulator [Rhodobacteraceae bacterium]|jgi:two-component system phosphate regulon response regulator PhoB|nr:response regulator [Paracoccaceae bacterium]MCZ8152660.1 response regulator [Paracoccaceae bacterium]MCZ8335599.1 response regulator [Paracoccaceae bacterium]